MKAKISVGAGAGTKRRKIFGKYKEGI